MDETILMSLDLRKHKDSEDYISLAMFSQDGSYRYMLSRDWAPQGKIITWVLLNPSVGNEKVLETTTKGCLIRSKAWGYSGMIVLNLFAYISTNPKELIEARDPVGSFNNEVITKIAHQEGEIDFIAAWGNHGRNYNRDQEVIELLAHKDLYCLGINKDGSPRHPLHLAHSIEPRLWRDAKK